MIRRLVVRWEQRRYSDPERLIAAIAALNHWTWLERYCNWEVARYGEAAGSTPRWLRPWSRFTCWLDDWKNVLSTPLWLEEGMASFLEKP